MRVLAVNAGSTSVKLSVVGDGGTTLAEHEAASPDAATADVIAFAEQSLPVAAVCHRIVHGGPELTESVAVDATVRRALDKAAVFAPLHVPPALHLLDVLQRYVNAPAIACFDTSFHAAMPHHAATYAIPEAWRELGIRRYGFHGLSCAWALSEVARTLDQPEAALQLVIAHLGGGCSVTAARDGHGVDTTMGFTPLEGLVMATRSGSIDPAAIVFLQTERGVSATEISEALEHRSGLLALGGSTDMPELLGRAHRGDAAAALAVDTFVHHVRRGIGAVAASLSRIDALVFTGGIGEHAAEIRDRVVRGLCIPVGAVLTVHAREDLEMARQAEALLTG